MKRATALGVLVILGLILPSSAAWAIDEEVRLRIFNLQTYDLLLETGRFSACDLEEGFILAPGDIPFNTAGVVSWQGQCNVALVWSIRYFTGLTVSVFFDSETGKLKAYSQSDEFHPSLLGPRCEDGVCEYRLLIFNSEPWWLY